MNNGRRIVVVDNHDSYTFNLVASLRVAARRWAADVDVLLNDDPQVAELGPDDLDALVISPGPGHPATPGDVGHLPVLLSRLAEVPVLGVCLGHQMLGIAAGAEVVQAEPHHGHLSSLTHSGRGLFEGLPQNLTVTRYHSLEVIASPGVVITAHAEDGVVMGLEVIGKPWHGLQFHPESVATQSGDRFVENFLTVALGTP